MRPLPPDFEVRYVASRTLQFLPPFGTVAVVALGGRSAFVLPTVATMLFGLLLVAGMARRRARVERPEIEAYANEDATWRRGLSAGKAKGEILPAGVGGLLTGGVLAATRKEARWLLLGVVLSALILVGLALRGFVYDRWLDRTLSEWPPPPLG